MGPLETGNEGAGGRREGAAAPAVVEVAALGYLRVGGGLGRRSGATPHSLPRPPGATPSAAHSAQACDEANATQAFSGAAHGHAGVRHKGWCADSLSA